MIDRIIEKVNERKGAYKLLQQQKNKIKESLTIERQQNNYTCEALEIIQKLALETQEQLTFHITDMVNFAVSQIPFQAAYTFEAKFLIKNNKPACEFLYVRDGQKMQPKFDSGGLLDVVSLALRLSLWSLKKGKKSNIFILDEPFKHLSDDLLPYACDMLRVLTDKLQLQVILITQKRDFENIADNILHTILEDTETTIKAL